MIGTKKPILIDLAYGRAGTFMGTKPSSLPHRIVVQFRPFNSLRTIDITDVPETALQRVRTAHPAVPREGVYFLFAGAGGVSPVMEEFDLMRGRVFEEITLANTRRDQAEAKALIAQRNQLRSDDETIDKLLKTVKAVKKSTSSGEHWPSYGRRNRSTLMPEDD